MKYFVLLLIGFFCVPMGLVAQQKGEKSPLSKEEIEAYEQQSHELLEFLTYSLNLVGAAKSTVREKETVFLETYRKLFVDEKVQIEDDLDAAREVVLYKDVQAYLKDVDFFFQDVKFRFEMEEVSVGLKDDGQLYMLMQGRRFLEGVDIQGDSIESVISRKIELNIDVEQKALKIASIYTQEMSEKTSLAAWWNGLSLEWKQYFSPQIKVDTIFSMTDLMLWDEAVAVFDTVMVADTQAVVLEHPLLFQSLRRLLNVEELNLSGQKQLADLAALSGFTRLKRLDISHIPARSLLPIRHLNQLEELHCEHSLITSLHPIRYLLKLQKIYCHHTPLASLQAVENLDQLEILYCYHSSITDLKPLQSLPKLQILDVRKTGIQDLSPLAKLPLRFLDVAHTPISSLQALQNQSKLESLNCQSTAIADLTPLQNCGKLQRLNIDSTAVDDPNPLAKVKSLHTVFCQNTLMLEGRIYAFMAANPNTVLVYQTEKLQAWWANMSEEWKRWFRAERQLAMMPSEREFQLLANISEVQVAGNEKITSLEPLQMLYHLRMLDCRRTGVQKLESLVDLKHLEELYCDYTQVADLSPLAKFRKLKRLSCIKTFVRDLSPLAEVKSLRYVNCDLTKVADLMPLKNVPIDTVFCDHTGIEQAAFLAYAEANPTCLVIYQTEILKIWWEGLPSYWRKEFATIMDDKHPERSRVVLQEIANLDSVGLVKIRDLDDLKPLKALPRLEVLHIEDAPRLQNILAIQKLGNLRVFRCIQSPVQDFSPLRNLKKLEVLDCSNSLLEELTFIGDLSESLRYFNCSGTPVRDLDALEGKMNRLEVVDCSHTEIRNLRSLETLASLRMLVCFQADRISERDVERFKEARPDCEVVFY